MYNFEHVYCSSFQVPTYNEESLQIPMFTHNKTRSRSLARKKTIKLPKKKVAIIKPRVKTLWKKTKAQLHREGQHYVRQPKNHRQQATVKKPLLAENVNKLANFNKLFVTRDHCANVRHPVPRYEPSLQRLFNARGGKWEDMPTNVESRLWDVDVNTVCPLMRRSFKCTRQSVEILQWVVKDDRSMKEIYNTVPIGRLVTLI